MSNTPSLEFTKLLRFVAAGLLNTVFGFVVFSAAILLAAPVWLAVLAGMILGTAFNFVTTGGYVFGDLSARRLPRFVLVYLLTFAANLALINMLAAMLKSTILAQALLTPPIALFSYYVMSRFVFMHPDIGRHGK